MYTDQYCVTEEEEIHTVYKDYVLIKWQNGRRVFVFHFRAQRKVITGYWSVLDREEFQNLAFNCIS